MKIFKTNPELERLRKNIEQLVDSKDIKLSPTRPKEKKLEEKKQVKAARVIQNFWKAWKIKQEMNRDPYLYYLSLIDIKEEKRQYQLSRIMYGRHIAELSGLSRIKNPFIIPSPHYHRSDMLSPILLKHLLSDFKIPEAAKDEFYIYIPIYKMEQLPFKLLENYIRAFPDNPKIDFFSDEKHPIVIIRILCDPSKGYSISEFKKTLEAMGFPASPWEIATNIRDLADESKNKEIKIDLSLPKSKKDLLESRIFKKIILISESDRHSTNQLAKCLREIIQSFPEANPQAIQRMALMLEITTLFYEYNYSRFAFCIYNIIHELALHFSINKDEKDLNQEFSDFQNTSRQTLYQILGLKEEHLDKVHFIASPAVSGTSAFTIALKLAKSGITNNSNQISKINVFEPAYYEFNKIERRRPHFLDPDILIICTGPIAGIDGVAPGVDINRFIEKNVDEKERKTHYNYH